MFLFSFRKSESAEIFETFKESLALPSDDTSVKKKENKPEEDTSSKNVEDKL